MTGMEAEVLVETCENDIPEGYTANYVRTRINVSAKEAGISIIGDIPIYIALDSAEVWAEPRHS